MRLPGTYILVLTYREHESPLHPTAGPRSSTKGRLWPPRACGPAQERQAEARALAASWILLHAAPLHAALPTTEMISPANLVGDDRTDGQHPDA